MKKLYILTIVLCLVVTSFGCQKIKPNEMPDIPKTNPIVKQIKVPVLMYHELGKDLKWASVVSKEKFEADITALQQAGYEGIFFSELRDYLLGKAELPKKPIIITLDDGYQSNYTLAFPIIKKLGMKITIAMIGWSVGRSTNIDSEIPITPHFSWAEAKEMYDSGYVDLLHHSYDLHSPEGTSYGYHTTVNKGVLPLDQEDAEAYRIRFTKDLNTLNQNFQKHIGILPAFYTYPYGAYTESSEQILKNLGFYGSITTSPAVRTFKTIDDLWLIPRLNISRDIISAELTHYITLFE